MKRLKPIPADSFHEVFGRGWRPVQLVGDAEPEPFRSMPPHLQCVFLASGESNSNLPYPHSALSDGRLVGGIDVYRDAPDDPVALNKDWYAVVASPKQPDVLFLDGPFKDSEHWLDRVPVRYLGIEVLGNTDPGKNTGEED